MSTLASAMAITLTSKIQARAALGGSGGGEAACVLHASLWCPRRCDSTFLPCDARPHRSIRLGCAGQKSDAEVDDNVEVKQRSPAAPLALHLSSSRKQVTAAFLKRLTVAELRKELELRGLQWRGLRKKELIELLLVGVEKTPDPLPEAFEASVESYYRDPLAERRYRVSLLKSEHKASDPVKRAKSRAKSKGGSANEEAERDIGHDEDGDKSWSRETSVGGHNNNRSGRRGDNKSARWRFFVDPIEAGCERYTGLDLHFLGTSSTIPTKERGVSAIAVRRDRAIWLFDCGEVRERERFCA